MQDKEDNIENSIRQNDICKRLQNEEYFMSVAFLTSRRSIDPVLKVGACIVDKYDNIISTGYNQMPPGGQSLPWSKTSIAQLQHKSLFICHAEASAILNVKGQDLTDCKIYITHNACNECAKTIALSGIKHVIYLNEWHSHKPKYRAAALILKLAGCDVRKHHGTLSAFNHKLL